ncbi:MAG: sulfite exporter TauE/SafE family protein [Oscillospiraceae bacterium]
MNEWIVLIAAGLLSGLVGSMGMGGGGVLLIFLTLFMETEQLNAQGINLLFFIPIAILAISIYAKSGKLRWKITLKAAVFGLLGAAVGSIFAGMIGSEILSKIFAVCLIALGLTELFKNKTETDI